MSEKPTSPHALRESVLREVFQRLDFDRGVRLVGILFENRIVLIRKFWSLLKEHRVRTVLEPLEPQEASALVGRLFDFDCDRLFLAFRRDWIRFKADAAVHEMIARIVAHQYVDHLEPWGDSH